MQRRQVNIRVRFRLLLWKNYLLVIRRIFGSAMEILTPVLVVSLLVLFRFAWKPEVYHRPFEYPPLALVNPNWTGPLNFEWVIAYSPKNDLLANLLWEVKLGLNLTRIDSYASSAALNACLSNETNRPLAGLDFDDSFSASTTKLPKNLKFKVRFPAELRGTPDTESVSKYNWNTKFMWANSFEDTPRNINSSSGGYPPGYYEEKFSSIQSALSKAFITAHVKRSSTNGTESLVPLVDLRRFGYPAVTVDNLLSQLESLVGVLFWLGFWYSTTRYVNSIALEKEHQLKETMKIMGLDSWLHWTAWFTKIMIFMLISNTLIVILLKMPLKDNVPVLPHTSPYALWTFLVVYATSLIMFIFLMSVLFSKSSTATAVSGCLWFISGIPYDIMSLNYKLSSLATKMSVCLVNNSGMRLAFQLIVRHEANLKGLQWSNFFKPVRVDDDLSVGLITIMLLTGSLLCLLMTLYLEQIFPGEFGVPEKWYFPIKKLLPTKQLPNENTKQTLNSKFMEEYPRGKKAGIKLKGLRKDFGNGRVAVKGLSLNMFEDEITVLLGDNGAGKTTTMSMLIGMVPPTAGTAIVNGCDLRTDIAGVRRSIGFCPQHNILFDELTVREHIVFFSTLKGFNDSEVSMEVQKLVKLLELEPKIDSQTKTLSGGMKRKLSVGIAFCGGSEVVLCDEPTSGMDPAARRTLWDLLQLEKMGRTIVLSTHFMDEADVLGDRVAILHSGELMCYGSSQFLKNMTGVGYKLICEKGANCNVVGVTQLLRKYVSDVQVDTNVGSELSYKLDAGKANVFKGMLKELDDRSKALGVESYGISLTSLEEVFMKVIPDDNDNDFEEDFTEKGVKGVALLKSQFQAMMLKRVLLAKHNWFILVLQFVISLTVLIIPVLNDLSNPGYVSNTFPPLEINLDSFKTLNTVVILANKTVTANSPGAKFAVQYLKRFENPGIPATLVQKDDIQKFIIGLSGQELFTFNNRYMIGVTVEDDHVTAWFNNEGHHTVPLTLAETFNALLKAHCPECSISVINAPLPLTIDSSLKISGLNNTLGTLLACSMFFMTAFSIMIYIRERMTKAKLLQFVSGVSIWIFWIAAFLWDMIIYLVFIVILMGTVVAFQVEGWRTSEELGRVSVLLLCYVWCIIPFTYLLSMFISVPSNGFTYTVVVSQCFGVIPLTSLSLFKPETADIIQQVFLYTPHFALFQGLYNLHSINAVTEQCKQQCKIFGQELCPNVKFMCKTESRCCPDYFALKSPGIGSHVISMCGVGAVLLLILFVKESRVLDGLFYLFKMIYRRSLPEESADEDGDVSMEKARIRAMDMDVLRRTNLVVKSLSKFYKSHLAVNQISLAVNSGECFGLLGVNGAGKTTTFKMLIGDLTISRGDAWILGISIKKHMKLVYNDIGYCPQFDALLGELTGRETLRIICLIRGIASHKIEFLSLRLAKEFNFLKHIDKQTKEYSGGNKRKLSTALALIGSPSVVYLDEPTTGMDPKAKRNLWTVMSKYRSAGKSIVLTSHSMEECEALCTRLTVMVNGEFKCLGSTQHLKNKFSRGYLLIIQMRNRNIDGGNKAREKVIEVKRFVQAKMIGAVLTEERNGRLRYSVPVTNTKWSMFDIMETGRRSLAIESYSLSQSSLEDVFLTFAVHQQEAGPIEKSKSPKKKANFLK